VTPFRIAAILLCSFLVGTVRALPPDFEISQFAGGLRDPATMAFAPDGRLFVGERISGKLRIITASGQILASPFLTLDVPPVRHRSGGLRGFAFDPNFPTSPYIYIFYTKQFPASVRHNRVSRFTVSASDANLANPASELVLLEMPFNTQALGSSGSHNGGAVTFGGDGKLYVTTGDGWDASNGYGAGDNVQSLSSYTGKLFRINKDGTIPTDNPFYAQTTGSYRAIYALGFRNPFAATTHPVTGEIFVFDVGTANGSNKDHIFKVSAGANYGHNSYAGIGTLSSTWAKSGTSIVSGGVWYFSNQFPIEFRERLFVTSWKKGLNTIQSITNTSVSDFASSNVSDQGPVYPCVSPDGSLYFLDSTYETSDGRIYKVSYTNINRAETPIMTPNGGDFVDSISVALTSSTPAATIRYTTDGSTPNETSPPYTTAISLTASTTIKAAAFATNFDPSTIASSVFNVQASVPPLFTNTLPNTAQLSQPFAHTAQASGLPAPVFTLDSAPSGMTINSTTGEIFWLPGQSGNVIVALRASNGILPDTTQQVTVSIGNFILSSNPDNSLLTQGGLHFSYFEDFPQALTSGTVPVPSVDLRQRDDNFRFRFEGFLNVPATGTYELIPVTSDSAQISIQGVNVTGQTVSLAAGYHAIVLDYVEISGPQDLQLIWRLPSLAEEAIPASAFYYFTTPYGIFQNASLPAYLGTFPTSEAGSLPAALSATGAFSNITTLSVSDGVLPYEPNAKLWSDGTDKRRWIALPGGQKIGFSANDSWTFPAGTVLIKHFEIGQEQRRIETRFEVIQESGASYLVTYRWRADQSDADLVPATGAEELIQFDGDRQQQWYFPTRAQCVACHNSSINYVLGANTRQLNKQITYLSGNPDNQLRTWSHLDLFTSQPSLQNLDALSEINDLSASLEHRVRSYLDSNCAYCHNTNAAPEGTNFVLEFDTPITASNIIDGPTTRPMDLGPLARIIAPRDPRHSVLYQHLAGNDPATRMPPIGRTIVHKEARETLVEWILSLPPANTFVDVTDYTRRWKFDGTTGDGTWRDTAQTPTYSTGQIGQSLSFDGINDAVDLGPIDVPGGTGLTITFWFRADDFGTSDARFLSKADGQFDEDHYWMVSTLNQTQLRFRLRAGGSTSNLSSDAGVLSAGVWTHVAARYDGSTMKLFKDGVEVASQAKTGVLDTNGTVDAAIGNQPTTASGGARPFDGLMDDVRIYPRALSVTEIATIRDAGTTLNSAPSLQIDPLTTAVGSANFITRANAASLAAAATDSEDGNLPVTWLSTSTGDVSPNALADGPHTLIATARDSNGSADSQLLRINVVPGFEGWAGDNGLPLDPILDHDGNGLTLLEEYAFEHISPIPPQLLKPSDSLTLRFPVNAKAIDLRFKAAFGESLDDFEVFQQWIPQGDAVIGPVGSIFEAADQFEVRVTAPDPVAPRKFGRIIVEKP
jgi:uncharacterized repeat protein (TIGR03806 family)